MSFILDALRKSETERQQQSGAEFSSIPSSSRDPQSFKWLWFLGLLLLVNIAVLIGILMRPDKAPDVAAIIDETPVEQVQVAEPSFAEKINAAKQNQPLQTEPPVSAPSPAAPIKRGRVLTIDEVRVNGTLQITDLHLDIHVYSDDPAERFVFINMAKHREQSKLEEGPVVVEITPDGVILEHQGTTFLLPRQ